jgi:hypothetical protein
MSTPPLARPLYLTLTGEDPVFAFFHPAADGVGSQSAVLMCPPFGWEECCSYRSRRHWAEQLAEAGHPTLRIDLPGAGDSGGSPRDAERVAAWAGAIGAAAEWLSSEVDGRRLAAIGIGLGGLLLSRAISDGAPIDEVVLWATPARGRTFVRELRAFGHMEAAKSSEGSDELQLSSAEGETGAGGFVLSAETTEALEGLEFGAVAPPDGRVTRALLLERDGIAVDERLRLGLEAAGVSVTVAPGNGYGAMMAPPHESRSPIEVFARTQAWLGEGSRATRAAPRELGEPPPSVRRPAVQEHAALELTVAGARIRETPLAIAQPFGAIFGVLAEPLGAAADVSAVLLNAGAHRRIGQGRMWVEAARRWAANGVPTLRLDLEGIGDADGDAARFSDMGELYTPELTGQVIAALDAMDARNLGPSYVLAGLCSGAYWAFHAALQDERATAAFMINPQTLFWDASLDTARVLRRGLRTRSSWVKLLRGQVPLGQLLALARRTPRTVLQRARRRWTQRNGEDELDRALDRLRDTGKRVQFLFSGLEPLCEEFELEGRLQRLERWPNVGFERIPGKDHILRPLAAQRFAHAALDRELERHVHGAESPAERPAPVTIDASGA